VIASFIHLTGGLTGDSHLLAPVCSREQDRHHPCLHGAFALLEGKCVIHIEASHPLDVN
jgi:hypothetical protein